MSVSISPIFNDPQYFDNDGLPLAGGFIYQYVAGSFSTQQTTYTTSAGNVANANPIQLDSSGRAATAIWLTDGEKYNLVLTLPDGTTVLEHFDQIVGVVGATATTGQGTVIWNPISSNATYVGPSQFIVAGNHSVDFAIGNRVRATLSSGFVYGTVLSVSFSSPNTVVTLTMDGATLDSSLTEVDWSALIVGGRTVDAGAVSYTSTLTYPTPNTVGGQIVLARTDITALQASEANDQLVFQTTGTAPTYVLTPTVPAASLTANQVFHVRFHAATTGAATINVSGLGAVSLKQLTNLGVQTDPIISAGQPTDLYYDSTTSHFIIVDPLPATPPSTAQPHGMVSFTSNGTFTVPTSVTSVKVTAIGGGGGGGVGSSGGGESFFSVSGGTGGFGGTGIGVVSVTAGTTVSVSIGAGGSPSGTGGTTSFGSSFVQGTGGGPGQDAAGGSDVPGNPGSNGTGAGSAMIYGEVGITYTIGGTLFATGGIGGNGSFTPGVAGRPGMLIVEW